MHDNDQHATRAGDEFARQAKGRSRGMIAEAFDFVRATRKWWLGPILAALLIFGVLVALSSSVVAPYIYALF